MLRHQLRARVSQRLGEVSLCGELGNHGTLVRDAAARAVDVL